MLPTHNGPNGQTTNREKTSVLPGYMLIRPEPMSDTRLKSYEDKLKFFADLFMPDALFNRINKAFS